MPIIIAWSIFVDFEIFYLLLQFLDKKKDMKEEGRSEKDLSESFAFLQASNKNEVNMLKKTKVLCLILIKQPSFLNCEVTMYLCQRAYIFMVYLLYAIARLLTTTSLAIKFAI